jgi:hypothetical protein
MNDDLSLAAAIVAASILAGCATPQSAKPVGLAARGHYGTCLKDTGSRIPADDSRCSAIGRSYSSEDLSSTGAITNSGALQLLDPSITVGH